MVLYAFFITPECFARKVLTTEPVIILEIMMLDASFDV